MRCLGSRTAGLWIADSEMASLLGPTGIQVGQSGRDASAAHTIGIETGMVAERNHAVAVAAAVAAAAADASSGRIAKASGSASEAGEHFDDRSTDCTLAPGLDCSISIGFAVETWIA